MRYKAEPRNELSLLPIDIEELQIEGSATVTAIEAAPAIATGEGSAVTGRFITRRVDEIYSIEVLGADGQIDTIEGTTLHPIWSVDRDDWVPLGELKEGEQLLSSLPSPHMGRGIEGEGQTATILAHQVLHRTTSVYNIEIHGQHVYQVGELGLLVHNECLSRIKDSTLLVREAQRTGRRFQASINDLFKKLWDGNLNPGIGTKPIGAGISEARAADGARIYFRVVNGIVEVLGKSDKSNQSKVIAEILRVFG